MNKLALIISAIFFSLLIFGPAFASGDRDKADAIRLGMTLQRCEKLTPKEREMFGEACPKPQAQETQNVAFQSN